jgi:integrase
MMVSPLSLKPDAWPEEDNTRWIQARRPAEFLGKPRPASQWSARRCRIVEQAYGQWLAWLLLIGVLDADVMPQDRVTEERVNEFVTVLQGRVSSASVGMMIGAFHRMMCVLDPASNWAWLLAIAQYLKVNARPERNRLAHMVSPKEVYDLGINLMRRARAKGDQPCYTATLGRDGLMIAMLICCPVRIKNSHGTEIGKHLRFDTDRYLIEWTEDETKTGLAYRGEFPPELTEWIDWYLTGPRKVLMSHGDAATRRLWINKSGRPMGESAVREQIKKRTRAAFGRHIWPHLFRAIAVTGLVDKAPEKIAIGPDLLGHTNEQTMQKHYILARGNQAHRAVQQSLLEERAEAVGRLKRNRKDK